MPFYNHTKTAILLFTTLVLISIYSLKNLNISCRVPSAQEVYSVEFEYFGMDSEQIEKLIAEPLEEKLRAVEGLVELTTTCEYSKCTTTALFKKGCKNPYIAISDAADSLYRTLPADAQRPRIYSSSAEQKAIFLAAFEEDFPALEKAIKPKLQAIEGVSEVMILGGAHEEIHAAFNGAYLSQAAIFPWNIANEIQSQNERGSLAIMYGEQFNKKIQFGTEINSLDAIKKIRLRSENTASQNDGASSVPLYALAEIKFENQRQDKIVRINGKECILLSVKTSAPENTIKITRQVKKVLKENLNDKIAIKTIYDSGAEQSQMLVKIFAALLQSIAASIAIVFITFASAKITALVSGFLCADLLFSLAIISAFKIPLDISTLSGITISIGLVSDSALFVCDIFCAVRGKAQEEFHKRLKKSIPALAISTATTVSVLAPLVVAENVVGGVKNLAVTSAIMVAVSALLAVIFLPITLNTKANQKPEKPKILLKLSDFMRYFYKKSYILSKICDIFRKLDSVSTKSPFQKSLYTSTIFRRKNRLPLFALGTLLPVALFFCSAKNLSMESASKIIYAQIEYNPERSYKSADQDALPFVEAIQKIQGVDYVRSEARRGCVELEIVVNKLSQKEKIAREISELENGLSGFLYVPLPAPKSKPVQSIQVAILGNENSMCRKIAKEAAAFLQTENFFTKNQSQVVLNFKDEENIISAKPVQPLLAKNEIALSTLASFLRWNLFAPVADKILLGGKIYDLRAGESNSAFYDNVVLENIKALSIPVQFGADTSSEKTESSSISVNSLFDFCEEKMPSKIYRKNLRRAAFFTIEVQSKKSDQVFNELKASLAKLNLPEGYSFCYPREFVQMRENYAMIFAAFVFAIFAIFILIAAQCENIASSLKALFTIPLSLVLPLALRAIFRQPLQLGDAVAMVFLSGLCVNNALYILNELNDNTKDTTPKEAAHSLLKSIVSSSLTTICGAVPVIILAQDQFSASLAFFMFWGTIGALISGVAVFPKLLKNNTKIKKKGVKKVCKTCWTYKKSTKFELRG